MAMGSSQSEKPQAACEQLLIEGVRYNVEHKILPSENAIAERLLARRTELKDAYEEMHGKLHSNPSALKTLLQLVLYTAAFWNPEQAIRARGDRDELTQLNKQISRKASELAALLEKRSELHNTSGFTSDTMHHVCEVIEEASTGNQLFEWNLKDRLHALCGQFDYKYWPSLDEFLQALAADADAACVEASDPLTAATTMGSRAGLTDFFRALFAAIDENSADNHGLLPIGFKLTDNTLATLANCALGLGPDELVDAAHVKRFRQRERDSRK
jgi:hypothetical protein